MTDIEAVRRDTGNTQRAVQYYRTAMTKIDRFDAEFGFGDVEDWRYSRRRLKAAQTYLVKALAELATLENPGPAALNARAEIGDVLEIVTEELADVDRIIAEEADR